MKKILFFLHSSIGMKVIMALTGLMMILFLLGHVLGNLLVFSGANSLNSYAYWLQNSPMLWVFRLGMLTLIILHSYLSIRTYMLNRSARITQYAVDRDIQLSFSAKMMLVSGSIITLFVIFHIFHLTLGWVTDGQTFHQLDQNGLHNVYQNIIFGFKNPWIAGIYIFSLLAIALHLHHAIKSLFQTLGFHHQNINDLLFYVAPAINVFILSAFLSIPLAVIFGFISVGGQ